MPIIALHERSQPSKCDSTRRREARIARQRRQEVAAQVIGERYDSAGAERSIRHPQRAICLGSDKPRGIRPDESRVCPGMTQRKVDCRSNSSKAPAAVPRFGSEFDAFLFSPIGDERNGMPLSVVSLLARRDLDPWQEAASLAAMPADAATRRLDALIRALPDQPLTLPDSGTIATRLIALLPRWTDPNIRPPEKQGKAADAEALALSRRTTVVAMIVLISMMVLIGAQLARLRNESPAPHGAADAPPAPITPSPTQPPPNHVQLPGDRQ
jgi:hypothetical protein